VKKTLELKNNTQENPCMTSKIIALYFLVFRAIFSTILKEVETREKRRGRGEMGMSR
jgi:hypothetical protein